MSPPHLPRGSFFLSCFSLCPSVAKFVNTISSTEPSVHVVVQDTLFKKKIICFNKNGVGWGGG